MNIRTSLKFRGAILAFAAGALLPAVATAQAGAAPGKWQYSTTVYGYLPTISGTTSFPTGAGAPSIDVSADTIIDALKMTFMGAFGAHNGRWGMFTDVLYLDVGGSKSQTRDFAIGNTSIPAGAAANLNLDLKSWIWTLGGEYRVAANPAGLTMDVLAGARMFDMTQEARWELTGNLGSIAVPGRSGSAEVSVTNWDGIVGVKGRYAFAGTKWSMPFYADIGAGDSDLTWQAAAGVTYAFNWGDLGVMWRYLEYNLKSGSKVQDLNMNGPMFGAQFRF